MNRRDYSVVATFTMYGKTAATLFFNEVWVKEEAKKYTRSG
jgi:hypothetical protein